MPDKRSVYELAGPRVWVAGHRGMVGAALVRRLAGESCEILTVDRSTFDLRCQADVADWMAQNRPDAVFLAAATVGGILANDTRPADFLYDNLAIETNVIHAAKETEVEKLQRTYDWARANEPCFQQCSSPEGAARDSILRARPK